MKDNTGNTPIFSFPGESFLAFIFFLPSLGLFFIIPIMFIVHGKPEGIISGILIITAFSWYLIKKAIVRVIFFHDGLRVNFLFRSVPVLYSEIDNIYFHQKGSFPWHLYVIKFKEGAKIKKATFYCSRKTFESVMPLLKEKSVRYSAG